MLRYFFQYKTLKGDLFIYYNLKGITNVILPFDSMDFIENAEYRDNNEIIKAFDNYFIKGETIDINFDIQVTQFQKRVFEVLLKTKIGDVLTYKDVANIIGCASCRAIGQALRRNPIPIVIPCHRIIGKGWEGGFAGDIGGEKMDFKRYLLEHEKKFI